MSETGAQVQTWSTCRGCGRMAGTDREDPPTCEGLLGPRPSLQRIHLVQDQACPSHPAAEMAEPGRWSPRLDDIEDELRPLVHPGMGTAARGRARGPGCAPRGDKAPGGQDPRTAEPCQGWELWEARRCCLCCPASSTGPGSRASSGSVSAVTPCRLEDREGPGDLGRAAQPKGSSNVWPESPHRGPGVGPGRTSDGKSWHLDEGHPARPGPWACRAWFVLLSTQTRCDAAGRLGGGTRIGPHARSVQGATWSVA